MADPANHDKVANDLSADRNDSDPVDKQIDMERKYQEALKQKQTKAQPVTDGTSPKPETDTTGIHADDDNKMNVDRKYIEQLREEARENRKKLEAQQKSTAEFQNLLVQHFGVDNPQDLKDKLEEARKSKEKEDESKLSRVEIAEKRAKELEKAKEEARIRFEQRERELILSRDETIIQNALIQAAVANDVVNPKQLLQLLKHEFQVDPDRLVPVYKAEDGDMTLDERVRVFLEDPDNWNLVGSKVAGSGSGSQGNMGGGSGGKRIYKKSELADMRKNRPQEYKDNQREILRAYNEGRVREG
jgi:hypothetical protein